MSADPLVTVVLPIFNGERFIEETLRSVLGQTYTNLEVVAMDDGSTDATPAILAKWAAADSRVQLHQQQNRGVAAARNFGISIAHGEFPEKIVAQVVRFEESPPEVGLVYVWGVQINAEGAIIRQDFSREVEGTVLEPLILTFFLGNASVSLIRRECFDRAGGYDERLRAAHAEGCEDWELALRIAEHFEYRVVPRYLVRYRQTSSMSFNAPAMARSYEITMRDLRSRHPEIRRKLRRHSRAPNYAYLHRKSHVAGDYGRAIRWWLRAFAADPTIVIHSSRLTAFVRSVVLEIASVIYPRLFKNRALWQQIRERILPRAELDLSLEAFELKRLQPLRLHDRLRQRRWRAAVQRSGASDRALGTASIASLERRTRSL